METLDWVYVALFQMFKVLYNLQCIHHQSVAIACFNPGLPLCRFQEFNLIDRKELVPLQELIDKLTTKDR